LEELRVRNLGLIKIKETDGRDNKVYNFFCSTALTSGGWV